MTFSNNKQSANLLAQSMTDIMNSNGHRTMFKKADGATPHTIMDPNAYDIGRSLSEGVSGTGMPGPLNPAKQTGSQALKKAPIFEARSVKAELEKIQKDRSIDYNFGDTGAMAERDLIVNKILSGTLEASFFNNRPSRGMISLIKTLHIDPANASDVNKMTTIITAINDSFKNNNQASGAPIKPTAASLVNSLVKMANYLGRSGYTMSEAITDNLIKSIVVEAKKKEDKKKKLNKLQEKMMRMKGKKNKTHECEEGDEECEFGGKKK